MGEDSSIRLHGPMTRWSRVDTLAAELRQLPGVESTNSLAELSKFGRSGNETKAVQNGTSWCGHKACSTRSSIVRRVSSSMNHCDFSVINRVLARSSGQYPDESSLTTSRRFAKQNDTSDVKFLMAAGTAGFDCRDETLSWRAR